MDRSRSAMSATPRLKKSETLEIRLPYPTKLAFMARCRTRGLSASENVRRFIDAELRAPARARMSVRRSLHLIAGALIAAAIGAAAAPSLAGPAQRSTFDRLDLNSDRFVSTAEFARLDADHDGKISFAEFSARPPPLRVNAMAGKTGSGRD